MTGRKSPQFGQQQALGRWPAGRLHGAETGHGL